MSIVTVDKNRYTVETLYQWDKNQTLEIRGLSLASIPEIHFTSVGMDRAIVRQASMSNAGVITAMIPNSLLQKPAKIMAYVCIYEGKTFESLYAIEIPVKTRSKPNDYTLENDDGEIYSFNALENLVLNSVQKVEKLHAQTVEIVGNNIAQIDKAKESALSEISKATDNGVEEIETAKNSAINEVENTGAQIISDCQAIKTELTTETKNTLDNHLATFEIIKSTLVAGNTEVTITDERITADSALTCYTSVWGVNPTKVEVSDGSVTLTFYAQSADLEVGVQVNG